MGPHFVADLSRRVGSTPERWLAYFVSTIFSPFLGVKRPSDASGASVAIEHGKFPEIINPLYQNPLQNIPKHSVYIQKGHRALRTCHTQVVNFHLPTILRRCAPSPSRRERLWWRRCALKVEASSVVSGSVAVCLGLCPFTNPNWPVVEAIWDGQFM